MTYSMYRVSDGAGDSGPMSDAVFYNDLGQPELRHNATPFVGAVMTVGSPFGRTFYSQDWWRTTPITEITDTWTDDEGSRCIRFKTKNSVYIWKEF